jgi:hypothetical protein
MGSLPIDPLSSDSRYSLRVAVLTAQAFWPSRLRFLAELGGDGVEGCFGLNA